MCETEQFNRSPNISRESIKHDSQPSKGPHKRGPIVGVQLFLFQLSTSTTESSSLPPNEQSPNQAAPAPTHPRHAYPMQVKDQLSTSIAVSSPLRLLGPVLARRSPSPSSPAPVGLRLILRWMMTVCSVVCSFCMASSTCSC